MKSDINSFHSIKTLFIYTVLILLFFSCSSTGNPKNKPDRIESLTQVEQKKQALEEPKKLRITYDAVWSPKTPFQILESGNLHESGVTYLIRYTNKVDSQSDQNFGDPTWIKVSSTNQDNQRVFPYLQNTNTGDVKTTYFPWKGRRSAVQTKILSKDNMYCRWEGIYNGFLLVVETEFLIEENGGENSVPTIMHKHVIQNLELF